MEDVRVRVVPGSTDQGVRIAGHALFSPGVSNALTWLFLGALAAATATQLWLAKRQIRHVRAHRDAVPRMFAEAISLDAHQKAADYTVAKTQMGMLEIVLGAFALLALTLGGLVDWLGAQWTRFFEPQSLAHGVALCASVAVLLAALELPFSIYRTFVIEARFGFNRMTPKLFILDLLKEAMLAAAFGIPLLLLVLWLMETIGELVVALRLDCLDRVQHAHAPDFPDLHRAAFQPFHPAPGSGSRWADRGTAAAVRIPFERSVCYGRFQAIEPWQRLLHRFRRG